MTDKPRNAGEYRSWWEANTDVPYGYCWCGCGERTKPAKQYSFTGVKVKGEPIRYLPYHHLRPKLTDAQETDICRRYEAGEGGDVIGKRHGVSASTVYATLERHGIKRRPSSSIKRLTKSQQNEVCHRYQAGESSDELAESFGVSATTVYNTLRRYGIHERHGYLSKVQQAEICHRYQDGEDGPALAEEFSVSHATVIYGVLSRHGVERRPYATSGKEATIHHLYEAGETVPAICERIGVGKGAVRGALKRSGVELRRGNRAFSDDQETDIVRRYQAGEKVRELATQHGVGKKAIYGLLWRRGVKLGFFSIERELSEADKDRVCELYLSGLSPRVVGKEFDMSDGGVRSVLSLRGIPQRSYAEAAKCASRPENERVLRNRLAKHLEREGFLVETETPMAAGGRSDIIATQRNQCLLIEVKVGKPLHGIGQLFGYRVGLDPQPDLALAVSETWLRKSPKSSSAFLKEACREAGVRLWGIYDDGTPFMHR